MVRAGAFVIIGIFALINTVLPVLKNKHPNSANLSINRLCIDMYV